MGTGPGEDPDDGKDYVDDEATSTMKLMLNTVTCVADKEAFMKSSC